MKIDNIDSKKYYTLKNMPKKIIPIPYSLPNNIEYIGITNIRGSEENFSEFNNLFRSDRAADNSDLDLEHGINLNINFNIIPFRVIDIQKDYLNVGDRLITGAFLFPNENKEIVYEFLLDDSHYINYLEEYIF